MVSLAFTSKFDLQEHSLTPTFLSFEKSEIDFSIPAPFELVVEQYPDHTAVWAGEVSWSYAQLNAKANHLAQLILEKRGIGTEPVSFLLSRPEAQIAAMLGILKAGKMYLPLDRHYPADRLRFMQADSQARLIVTDEAHRSFADQLPQEPVDTINFDKIGSALVENPGIGISPDHPVYILYTSGSAGRPKGVLQNHRACYTVSGQPPATIKSSRRIILVC